MIEKTYLDESLILQGDKSLDVDVDKNGKE